MTLVERVFLVFFFLQLPLGERFLWSDTHHCFKLVALVQEFPFKICFVIFHQEHAIWEELGYHTLVSYSIYFNVNLCSQKVSIRLLDITACCINSIQPQETQVKFPGERLTVAFRNDLTSIWGHPSS